MSIPDLAYFDEAANCYKVDTGKYQIQVGPNSRDIALTDDLTVTGAMNVYPEVLTAKPNQDGDTALGIEERPDLRPRARKYTAADSGHER